MFKVVIVGDTNCGKSKFLQRFCFDDFDRPTTATIGVEYAAKNVEINDGQTKIRLVLWDTAGSERYRAMTINHFRGAVGAIMVYDISSIESYNSLNYWLRVLKDNLDPYALIALCPNKVDIMFSSPEKREVLREQGMNFARVNDLLFVDECSALADINVRESVFGLVKGIYDIQKQLVEQGVKDERELKVREEELSLNFEHRCCY